MRRIVFISTLMVSSIITSGQIFSTGQTLKPSAFSFGIEPAAIIDGNSDFILFLHGGVGIKKGIDFAARAGVLGPDIYFGGDIEFALPKKMSLAFGAHQFSHFGLDGTWNISFPIRNDLRITSGIDTDLNFTKPDLQFLLWLPISLEIGIKKNMNFIFEVEIGLTDPAYHFIGGGLNFYL